MVETGIDLEELIMLAVAAILIASGGVTFGLTTIVGLLLLGKVFELDVGEAV